METSRGPGLAHFMIDYGPESHLMWVVFMDADGACWTVPNPEVRMQSNWSLQRRPARKPFQPAQPIQVVPTTSPHPLNGHATNGHPVNGHATLNGHDTNGHRRYDAAPDIG